METKITGIQLLKLPESVKKQRKATHSVILSTQNFDAQTQKLLISVDNKISEINPKTKEAEITIKEKPKHELQTILASADTYRVKGHIVDPETTKISGSVSQEFHSQVQNFQHTKTDGLHKTSDVILGEYNSIIEKWKKEIQEKPEILQLFFAKLSIETKEGKKPRRKIESVDTAKLGDELYIVCKTKNMQGKKVRIYVHQGRQDVLGRTDENIELFMNTGFSLSMEMTVGKEASQNQYSNSGQLKDYAYGKIKLIPKETIANSDENLKKWQEILKNAQDHQTFLYIYAEMVEDTSVFLDDSKNEEFLAIKGEDVVKDQEQKKLNQEESENNTCGIQYRNSIICVRYGKNYGPLYNGIIPLKNFKNWNIVKISKEEKEIILAMSENEGNLDAVQSYDSEIITVGAMQKTINSDGYGELSKQFWDFKQENPIDFKVLMENCGWNVKQEEEKNKKGEIVRFKYKAYYNDKTGKELKAIIRNGFIKSKYKEKVKCVAMEPIINLCKNENFQAKQIGDFIVRLNLATNKKPLGYTNKIKDFMISKLGKATILDHDVNRPGHVSSCFGKALDQFFQSNNSISKDPLQWKDKHSIYENKILEIYGPLRGDRESGFTMTDASSRYNKLKQKLT
ncbi:hypothetical protein [uncultured Chryseobacterium sp.]|uniref:hypothetical protein n=1 Tax=uncultured Chryseobacterium sp. TaxID=259322 RepID=UPI0025EB2CE0|nr:hypothetical protein [uncultured Chryseobacterium sp.]